MAHPQRIIDQNGSYIDEEAVSPAEQQRQETIDDIFSAFGESSDDETWQMRVYRVTGSNRQGFKEPWLFNCSVEELPIEQRLSDEYGTGIYRCKAYRNNRLFKHFTCEVEKTEKPAVAATSEISTILAAFQESQNRMMAILESRLNPPPISVAPDPFDMLAKMANASRSRSRSC